VSPLKTVAPRVKESKPAAPPKPKAPRTPKAAPPPVPVMGMSVLPAKPAEPAPLVDLDALRERAAQATKEVASLSAELAKPKEKSVGGKRSAVPSSTVQDSSVLG
jgi:hypothetical protein